MYDIIYSVVVQYILYKILCTVYVVEVPLLCGVFYSFFGSVLVNDSHHSIIPLIPIIPPIHIIPLIPIIPFIPLIPVIPIIPLISITPLILLILLIPIIPLIPLIPCILLHYTCRYYLETQQTLTFFKSKFLILNPLFSDFLTFPSQDPSGSILAILTLNIQSFFSVSSVLFPY